MIEDALKKDTLAAAEQLVSYLDQKGQLYDIIEMYLDKSSWQEAEKIRMDALEKNTGVKQEENKFAFHYQINPYNSPDKTVDLLFFIRGKEGIYYYTNNDCWTLDNAVEYARSGESSIAYVENWFGEDYRDLFSVFYLYFDNSEKTGMSCDLSTQRIYVYNDSERKNIEPITIAYEVVHQIVTLFDYKSNGFYEDSDGPKG